MDTEKKEVVEKPEAELKENLENLEDEKKLDSKTDKGKVPFIISAIGLIAILAGAFMYFIQLQKSN